MRGGVLGGKSEAHWGLAVPKALAPHSPARGPAGGAGGAGGAGAAGAAGGAVRGAPAGGAGAGGAVGGAVGGAGRTGGMAGRGLGPGGPCEGRLSLPCLALLRLRDLEKSPSAYRLAMMS